MYTSSLMKQILSSDNLNRAYLQVVRNKGAEGVDGMKYTELKEHLVKNGEIIKEQLRTRKYKPQPVRRVEIPKPDGGVRNLGVPTVTDRFIQQAIAQVLTPIYEEQFHDHSYGFRPNRCAQQAILTALDMMNDGKPFILKCLRRRKLPKGGCRVSVSGMLKFLGVSRSGYLAWLHHVPSDTEKRRKAVKAKIQDIYDNSKQNYGAPKITVELRKTGEVISERTVGTYMRQMGIRAQWSKP